MRVLSLSGANLNAAGPGPGPRTIFVFFFFLMRSELIANVTGFHTHKSGDNFVPEFFKRIRTGMPMVLYIWVEIVVTLCL